MLKEKIKQDLFKATKDKEEINCLVLRQLLAAVLSKEKEKRYDLSKQNLTEQELEQKSCLSEEEVISIISNEAKKRRESIQAFEKGNREELAKKERKELEILEKYLPEQLSEQEIEKLIKEAITKTGAQEIKDMGKVMAELSPKIKGKTDGGIVSRMVKEILQ